MKSDRKEYIKEWKRRNKEKCRSHFQRWYNNGGKEKLAKKRKENPKIYLDSLKRTEEKFPEKRRARLIVMSMVKNGTLKKMPCVKCGEEKSFAHHDDYSKPMEVTWVCRRHHFEIHFPL